MVEIAPRAADSVFNDSPVAVKLNDGATIDDPQQASGAEMHERNGRMTAEQSIGVPTAKRGLLCPSLLLVQKRFDMVQELAPSERRNTGERARS